MQGGEDKIKKKKKDLLLFMRDLLVEYLIKKKHGLCNSKIVYYFDTGSDQVTIPKLDKTI